MTQRVKYVMEEQLQKDDETTTAELDRILVALFCVVAKDSGGLTVVYCQLIR